MHMLEPLPTDDNRLLPAEYAVAAVMVVVGLAISDAVEIYDLRSGPARIALTLVSISSTYCLFWLGLWILRRPATSRARGALLAALPSALLASQVPYLGHLFIPIEILASMWLLRSRAGLGLGQALLASAAVRIVVLLLVHALSAVLRLSVAE